MNRRDFINAAAGGLASIGVGSHGSTRAANSQAPKVRVGVIGVRHSHTTGKLEAIRQLSDVFELIGIVEPDAALRKSRENHPKYQGVLWLSENELLESPNLEAVIIETGVHDLTPTAERCIAKKKHVHLEKPGSNSRVAFTRLFESARERRRHIQLGYMLRHNPAFDFCFRAVRDGVIGRVFEVTAAMSKLVDDTERRELAENPGGAMFELGCHLVDSVVTILGAPAKVRAFSRETRTDGMPDNQLAVLEYRDAIATIRSSIVEPFGNERRHFDVSGENGTIAIRPLEPPQVEVLLKRPAGKFRAGRQSITLPASEGRYHLQMREFAAIIRGKPTPRWSADHDLAVHLAVLQASGLPTDTDR
jgi:predicted dehydrogenase